MVEEEGVGTEEDNSDSEKELATSPVEGPGNPMRKQKDREGKKKGIERGRERQRGKGRGETVGQVRTIEGKSR